MIQFSTYLLLQAEPDSPRSWSSSYTGEPMLPLEVVDNVIDDVIKFGIREGVERVSAHIQSPSLQVTPPSSPPPDVTPPIVTVLHGEPSPIPTAPPEVTTPTAPPTDKQKDLSPSAGLGPSPKKTVISKTGIQGKGGSGKKNKKSKSSKGHRLFTKAASADSGFLDPSSLQPSTSRMSVAWSTTSTRDDGSMPPSPTELDTIALRMAIDNIEDYCSLIADMAIRSALASLRQSSDINSQLMKQVQNTTNQAKIDSFLHSLEEAGPVADDNLQERLLLPYSPRWYSVQKNTLRPVATGNWGCGAFKGDPQLKALLQWMAISSVGRPEMKYCTFKDARMEQVSNKRFYGTSPI